MRSLLPKGVRVHLGADWKERKKTIHLYHSVYQKRFLAQLNDRKAEQFDGMCNHSGRDLPPSPRRPAHM